ncbi:MAG: M24 family metallopeptidase [Spirochaetia bacterium]
MNEYTKRQEAAAQYLRQHGLAAAVLEDTEGRRNISIRYLTGHPGDALLFFFASGEVILVPWDLHLAEKIAVCSKIIPYTDFERKITNASKHILKKAANEKAEFQSSTPYPLMLELQKELPEISTVCKDHGFSTFLQEMRSVKTTEEIETYRTAWEITEEIRREIVSGIKAGTLKTEFDTAMHIEKRCRELGCEGTGFETLCAGPERSWGIHAFPAYTSGSIQSKGLTIIDFGVNYNGYRTDITMTIASGPLSQKQSTMCSLVEEAYKKAVRSCIIGADSTKITGEIQDFFKQNSYSMPHALGHGIGLEAHELPVFRTREKCSMKLKENMVLAIEPGLYDQEAGGVRLENDVIITSQGPEIPTKSQIIYI